MRRVPRRRRNGQMSCEESTQRAHHTGCRHREKEKESKGVLLLVAVLVFLFAPFSLHTLRLI